jgi:hypothetical protein
VGSGVADGRRLGEEDDTYRIKGIRGRASWPDWTVIAPPCSHLAHCGQHTVTASAGPAGSGRGTASEEAEAEAYPSFTQNSRPVMPSSTYLLKN